jgi:hypothetical protein
MNNENESTIKPPIEEKPKALLMSSIKDLKN